jgi:DDE family transposase
MWTVAQVSTTMQTLLTTTVDGLARETGFVRRASKLSGAHFVQALVLGWLNNPNATLQQLAQMAGTVGVPISPQGLDQRFSRAAADLLHRVLEAAVGSLVTADPVAIPLLQRFAGVYLLDSSTIVLPNELAAIWQGCGGGSPEGGERCSQAEAQTTAAIKLQVQLDLLTGALRGPVLQDGRAHDRQAPHQTEFAAGALRLSDLGYFSVEVFASLEQQGVYWLSRLHILPQVFDTHGQPLDLLAWLPRCASADNQVLDVAIQLGATRRLPVRLLVQHVPLAVAEQRRKHLREEAQRKGQTLSQRRLALAEWTLLVTNVPARLLSAPEALVLLRARWQVELLFKLWKSHGLLDESRSSKPWRRLCELYAKMLALLLQHWLLILSCWRYPDRSLVQAAQTIQRFAIALALELTHLKRLAAVVGKLQECLRVGCRITKRKAAPATYQLLLASTNVSLG